VQICHIILLLWVGMPGSVQLPTAAEERLFHTMALPQQLNAARLPGGRPGSDLGKTELLHPR